MDKKHIKNCRQATWEGLTTARLKQRRFQIRLPIFTHSQERP